MGTLEKDGSSKPLSFDGKAASWPPFAAAQAAKSTTKSGKGTVSSNVADYKDKDLQAAFASATVTTSVLLELIANRKTVLGAHHAD